MVCSIYIPIFSRLETKILEKMAKNPQIWPKMAYKNYLKYFKFFSAKSGLTNVVRIGLN